MAGYAIFNTVGEVLTKVGFDPPCWKSLAESATLQHRDVVLYPSMKAALRGKEIFGGDTIVPLDVGKGTAMGSRFVEKLEKLIEEEKRDLAVGAHTALKAEVKERRDSVVTKIRLFWTEHKQFIVACALSFALGCVVAANMAH